jgi:uncharacterized small protein (DUF1192 family)
MLDLDAIKKRHLAPDRGQGKTYYEGHIEVDLAALVAEIERLRAEVDLLRTGREAARNYADRVEAEVVALRGERAAVVAWLRGEPEQLVECNGHRHADGKPCWVMSPMPAAELADAIERGEHRRAEGA